MFYSSQVTGCKKHSAAYFTLHFLSHPVVLLFSFGNFDRILTFFMLLNKKWCLQNWLFVTELDRLSIELSWKLPLYDRELFSTPLKKAFLLIKTKEQNSSFKININLRMGTKSKSRYLKSLRIKGKSKYLQTNVKNAFKYSFG